MSLLESSMPWGDTREVGGASGALAGTWGGGGPRAGDDGGKTPGVTLGGPWGIPKVTSTGKNRGQSHKSDKAWGRPQWSPKPGKDWGGSQGSVRAG